MMVSFIAVSITAVSLFFGHGLVSFFTESPAVVEQGDTYLSIVSPFYIIFGAMFTVSGVMRGAGDTLLPMFFTMFSWALILLLAWQFSENMGVSGIWWAMPAGWSSGFILSSIYYLTGNWKKKGVAGKGQSSEKV
jgi:Na+-driven multidrug efflux pump